MEDEFREVEVYGTLEVHGFPHLYYLLRPYPVKLDDWMNETEQAFCVAEEKGVATHIITNEKKYILNYAENGKKIKIKR